MTLSHVRKFTEDIDKARVVRARVLANKKLKGTGKPIEANASLHDLARMLVDDKRSIIPVVDGKTKLGGLKRQEVLDVLFGEGA